MKEKSVLIILVTILVLLGTVLSSMKIKQDNALSFHIENCADSQDLSSEFDETDSEEPGDSFKDKASFFAKVNCMECYYCSQTFDNEDFRLITPPPQL